MGIEQELTDVIDKYEAAHGMKPGYLFVGESKWQEMLVWEPSGKPSMPGAFKGGIQVKLCGMLPEDAIHPESHAVDPRTWNPINLTDRYQWKPVMDDRKRDNH